jgi:hypothetical protein
MKRTAIIIVIMFSFFILTNNTMATCPPAFSQYTAQITINGCLYNVEICYTCVVTNPPIRVMVNAIQKVDPNCQQLWDINQVTEAIWNIVNDANFVSTNLCSSTPPPCTIPISGLDEEYVEYKCWHKLRISPTAIRYEKCPGSDSCVTKYKICWDPINHILVENLVSGPSWGRITPPQCPFPEPEPADPINVGEYSACFTIKTSCGW